MDFEVVLIEVIAATDVLRPLLPTTRVAVYCLRGDSLFPPEDSQPLVEYSFRDLRGLQKFHLIVLSDVEFGYRLCQLQRYRPMIYTSRTDVAVFHSLGLFLGERWECAPEVTDSGEDSEPALLTQLHAKVRSCLQSNPDSLLCVEPSAAFYQISNMATGVIRAFCPRNRSACVPAPEDLAEKVYTSLCDEGLLAPLSKRPQSEWKPTPQGASPMRVDDQFSAMKKEALRKYIQNTLQSPMVRASKEKAAKNQLVTFLHGPVLHLKQKNFPNVPTADQLATPMFSRLKVIGVIIVQGGSVSYDDVKIRRLLESSSLQDEVACAEDLVEELKPTNLRLSILYRAFHSYYTGILTAEECKGRTESAVKQQVRNNVRHSLEGVRRENLTPVSELPHEDDVTTAIVQVLFSTRAISRQGGQVRYNIDSIAEVGQKLAAMTLFSDSDLSEPTAEVVQKRVIIDRVLCDIRDQPGMTIGKLYDICYRRVLGLRFDAKGASSPSEQKSLVMEVMKWIVTEGGHTVELPTGVSLESALGDSTRYGAVGISSTPGDVYSEDLDA